MTKTFFLPRKTLAAASLAGLLLVSVPAVQATTPSPENADGIVAPIVDIQDTVLDIVSVSEDIEGTATTAVTEDKEVLTLAADVTFGKDSSVLNDKATKVLDEALAEWKTKDISSVEIVGHTDSVDGQVPNQKLSTDRAAAVEEVLKDELTGVTFESEGVADSNPRAEEDGTDEEVERARALNRRVEITVTFEE